MGTLYPQGDAEEQAVRHPRRRGGLQPVHFVARPRAIGPRAALALFRGDRLDSGRTLLLRLAFRDRAVASLLARVVVDLHRGLERHRHLYDVQPAAVAAGRTLGRHAEARLCKRRLRAGAVSNPHRRSPVPGDRGQVPVVRPDVGRTAMGAQSAFRGAGRLCRLHRSSICRWCSFGAGASSPRR